MTTDPFQYIILELLKYYGHNDYSLFDFPLNQITSQEYSVTPRKDIAQLITNAICNMIRDLEPYESLSAEAVLVLLKQIINHFAYAIKSPEIPAILSPIQIDAI